MSEGINTLTEDGSFRFLVRGEHFTAVESLDGSKSRIDAMCPTVWKAFPRRGRIDLQSVESARQALAQEFRRAGKPWMVERIEAGCAELLGVLEAEGRL